MKKLLKVLIVFVVMFGFSGTVMAYVKPNGTFYTYKGVVSEDTGVATEETSNRKETFYTFSKLYGDDTDRFLPIYALSESSFSKIVSGTYYRKNSNEKCYIKNIPKSTKNVYFTDYQDTSSGSTLKKIWQQKEKHSTDANDIMAACYANSLSSTNGKFYLFGFSDLKDDDGMKICHNYTSTRKSAYIWASQINKNGENIKYKDYKYGFGKKFSQVTIGASWACKGKNTSGFDECKGTSYDTAKFTDRKVCPLYAGYKYDGDEYYYFTDNYRTNFDGSGYTHMCVAYDADFEIRIQNLLGEYKGEILKILDKYNDGDIESAKLRKQFDDKLNEMYLKMFNNEYVGDAASIKNGELIIKDDVINHCEDYKNYINDELIDISDIKDLIDQKIKNAQEAENLKSLAEEKTEETKKSYEMATQFLKNGFTGPGIDPKDLTCEEMLGKNLTKILKFAIEVLSIAGAIIAIVNAMISLIPALIAKDGEALKKAQKKCINMAIVLILILLLPTLIVFIGRLFGYDLSCFSWLF